MRRLSLPLWVLFLSACCAPLVSGCGSDDGSGKTAPPPAPTDLEGRLQADTGVRWIVDRDDAGQPAILTATSAPPPIAASTPRDQATIAFFQGYADVLGAGKLADELVLAEDRDDALAPGAHHLRFAQRIPGSDVRVFGADLFAHFDASGSLRFAEVGFVRDLAKLSAKPGKTADEARAAAMASIRRRDPNARVRAAPKAPELVVYRTKDGRGILAWRLFLEAVVNGSVEVPALFVDATSLAVLEENDEAAHAGVTIDALNAYAFRTCARGTPSKTSRIVYDDAFSDPLFPRANRLFQPADATRSAIVTDRLIAPDLLAEKDVFYTAPIVSTDPERWDVIGETQGAGAAVSTHENVARVDQFFRTLGYRGWNVLGTGTLTAIVHGWTWDREKAKLPVPVLERNEVVAFYNPGADALVFGDGEGCTKLPAGLALDVVAHEYTHALVANIARIGLVSEAGSLNEAVADVFGAAAEHWAQPDHDPFVMGEDLFLAKGGVRSLREPRRFPSKLPKENVKVPRSYGEKLDTENRGEENDFGHRHDNSVMIGHAFYLMTVGGKHEVSKIEVSEPLGWDVATGHWNRSLLGLDHRYTEKFRFFARVNTNLALLSVVSPIRLAPVACAWRAIEVFNDGDMKDYGVTCAGSSSHSPAPPPGPGPVDPGVCAGHGNDLVCDELQPFSATVCKSGQPIDTAFCADREQRCKRRAPDDATAQVAADGTVACE